MKLISCFVCALLLSMAPFVSANAETPWKQVQASDLTDENVKQVVEKLRQAQIISGQFSQEKVMQGMKMPIKSSGDFIFWREHGLYQEAKIPFFNAFTITEDQLINWNANGKGTLIKENAAIVQREINKTLLSFFKADIVLIAQRFDTEWDFYTEGHWRLRLTPKLAAIAEHMTLIELAGADLVESLRITAGNGDITHMQFSHQVEKTTLSVSECQRFFLQPAAICQSFK